MSGGRIAGAPVSWGVIEVPDWGYQMPADRVLGEASSLGLPAVEAGPEGLLPADPSECRNLLSKYGLGLVGGFVPAVLHDPGRREEELDLYYLNVMAGPVREWKVKNDPDHEWLL